MIGPAERNVLLYVIAPDVLQNFLGGFNTNTNWRMVCCHTLCCWC